MGAFLRAVSSRSVGSDRRGFEPGEQAESRRASALRVLGRVAAGLAVLVAAFLFDERASQACAVCGAADKTLPTNGNEIAFTGRVRATLDGRAAAFAGRSTDVRITEVRLVPGGSLALGEAVMLSADVPILRRSISTPASSSLDRVVLGDPELRASYLAYRSGPSTPSRRLVLHAGAKAPIAPLERDARGRFVPTDLQPGCGSVVPSVGATYTWTGSLVSAWASASLLMPISTRSGPHPGDSVRGSITFQLQPTTRFAARLGAHARIDASGDIDGQIDPRSGGAALHLAPELVTSPIQDLVVSVGASFPTVQEMRGYRATSPVVLASIAWDF